MAYFSMPETTDPNNMTTEEQDAQVLDGLSISRGSIQDAEGEIQA